MKKSHLPVKIYGSALNATIKAMDSLGKVGLEILKHNNAANIKDKELYPTSMRSIIYDSLFDRYGEPVLRAIGFAMGDIWAPIAADKLRKIIKNSGKKQFKVTSNDHIVHPFKRSKIVISLNDFVVFYTDIWDIAIKKYTFAGDSSYRAVSEKLGKFKYRLTLKSPGTRRRHLALIRENLDGIILPFIAREWEHSFMWDKAKTREDNYGCRFVFTLEFRKKERLGNAEDQLIRKRKSIMDEFLHSVLEYSEDQRNKLENLSRKLGKYIPPQIHESLFSGRHDTEITTRRKKLTIFFSDIANFTSTSEGLQPEDLTMYLNEYFSEMTTIALECGATIDKYIGDAMMVFFGDPESKGEKEDARGCVEMALKMQDRMVELQDKWANEGFADPFQVRMGINSGYCNVGNFGSDQRLTYTIIGGEVNVAQRLEASADANGILMSYETYAHAQDMVDVEERPAIKMKGISREIKIFSVRGRKNITKVKRTTDKKKPTKQELSEIERIKEDVARIYGNLDELNKKMDVVLKKR